jgi:hypothetical protein
MMNQLRWENLVLWLSWRGSTDFQERSVGKRGGLAQVRKIWFYDCPEEAALASKNTMDRKRKIWFCGERKIRESYVKESATCV